MDETEDKTTCKVVIKPRCAILDPGPPTARMHAVGATPARQATNPDAWSILRGLDGHATA